MSSDRLALVKRRSTLRMVGDGVHYADIAEVYGRITDWEEWFDAWAEKGEQYAALAREALAQGHRVSAGEWFWQASICYQYAQFQFSHRPEKRRGGQQKKVECYRLAAPCLVPPAERVEVSFEGHHLPGYLRVPPSLTRPPCVILIGGLDSTKEESYHFENMCLRRGVATFTFDGPGQGEVHEVWPLRGDFEVATSTVVDYLETRREVDSQRLGVLGRSLGGYYAARSAAHDPRLKACVVWAALYDVGSIWDDLPPPVRENFIYGARKKDPQEALEYVRRSIDLSGCPERIRGHLYISQGRRDDVCPPSHAERLYREAVNARSRNLAMDDEGEHCSLNLYPTQRPRMADWLADHL